MGLGTSNSPWQKSGLHSTDWTARSWRFLPLRRSASDRRAPSIFPGAPRRAANSTPDRLRADSSGASGRPALSPGSSYSAASPSGVVHPKSTSPVSLFLGAGESSDGFLRAVPCGPRRPRSEVRGQVLGTPYRRPSRADIRSRKPPPGRLARLVTSLASGDCPWPTRTTRPPAP